MKVGIAWYKEAEWELLRQAAVDADVLEASYDEWLQTAKKSLREMAAAGVGAEKVEVSVAELQRWCEQEGRRLDGRARSDYAAELLRTRYEGSEGERGA